MNHCDFSERIYWNFGSSPGAFIPVAAWFCLTEAEECTEQHQLELNNQIRQELKNNVDAKTDEADKRLL